MTEPSKCSVACNFCRVKKIKCSSQHPCTNCLDHNVECVFPSPHIRPRVKIRESNKVLRERIARLEALVAASATLPRAPCSPDQRTGSVLEIGQQIADTDGTLATPRLRSPSPIHTRTPGPMEGCTVSQPLQPLTPETSLIDSIVSPSMSNLEYHGPTSYLSICSNSAGKWLSERAGSSAMTAATTEMSLSVTRRMKLERGLTPTRQPEPDAQTAWSYVQAYFDKSLDCIFGVINRQRFQTRLLATFDGSQGDDFAWYALRNTVYAAGSKILMMQGHLPDAFANAQDRAWGFFENALSVHTDLVYVRSDSTAIQALMTMAFYCEGFGNPALEYMLISNALRLAQSKGLHRQPLPGWNMKEEEIRERNWLFWVIYAYEKHIAFRSGRPSAIDDDEISCQVPTQAVPGSGMNAQFVTQVIRHSQISSAIARELTSFKASQQPRDVIAGRVRDLEARLQLWYDSLTPELRHVPMGWTPELPVGLHPYHRVFLHFSYHGSLIAIHSAFTYPWDPTGLRPPQGRSALREQVALSTKMVMESSRQIILATKWFDLQGSYPTWLAFFYPLLGLINIFVSILRAPTQSSTAGNLALTDVAAGHFGYLEFLSNNKMSFPYVSEMSSLARAMVQKARERQTASSPSHVASPSYHVEPQGESLNNTDNFNAFVTTNADSPFPVDFGSMTDADFGLEAWPTCVPSLSMVSSMVINTSPGEADIHTG